MASDDEQVPVWLPFVCRVFEGKILGKDETSGTVVRLGRRRVDVRLDGTLPLLTNLRFRLNYPGLGYADWSAEAGDRKSTRLNSSHVRTSYAVFCFKKKKTIASPCRAAPW